MSRAVGEYLSPYENAARQHGAGFESLLWASPLTQRLRFGVIASMANLAGKIIADIGCGRADLFPYLNEIDQRPAGYIGVEGIPQLAAAARKCVGNHGMIVEADFVSDPVRMFVGADIVIFSGSLNTLDDSAFYSTLTRAYDAATLGVVFNFLSSYELAGKDYLHWRGQADVLRYASNLSKSVWVNDDYLPGDTTVAMFKVSVNEEGEERHA